MIGFSTSDIVRFRTKASALASKAKQALDRADEAVATVVTTAEVSAASFLFGLAQGKYGGIALVGVPVDLLAGLGLHILAFAGIGGKNSHHLHAFGDGALASFFGGIGRQVGRSIQSPEDRARIATSVQGALDGGTTGGGSLADEELARMVAADRR